MGFLARIIFMLLIIALFGSVTYNLALVQGWDLKTIIQTKEAPLPAEAVKDGEVLPQSLLHYPSLEEIQKLGQERAVSCYLDEKYEALVAARHEELGTVLTATAQIEEETMEMYTAPDGSFFVLVKGPDASGRMEACEVSAGKDWKLVPSPAAAP